jgi:c-di-GMP-binding flagellar brake protein YcgR
MAKEKKRFHFGFPNIEKRRHPRSSANLPIEYWQIKSVKSISGRTANVSEGGLLLQLSEPPEVGQNFRIALFFGPDHDLDFIEVPVQVVWKDIHPGREGDYRAGVKFIDISPEVKDKLKNFLNILFPSH